MANVVVNDQSLSAIGSAIRQKNGLDTKYKPAEMSSAILAIPTGGKEPVIEKLSITENGIYNVPEGIDGYNPISVNVPSGGGDLPVEALVITGDCSYRFANGGWDWFIENYGDRITTNNISNAQNMFYACQKLFYIPFDINIKGNVSLEKMFSNCGNLKNLPNIHTDNGASIDGCSYMFEYDNSIREIPESFSNIDFSYMNQQPYASFNSMFSYCMKLYYIPIGLLEKLYNKATSAYSSYARVFFENHQLNKIENLGINQITLTSNLYDTTFSGCNCLKTLTFKNSNPVNWKSQTIDLSNYVGYGNPILAGEINPDELSPYYGKEVKDATTYEQLKNEEYWFTTKIEYSRYNHDSAVETINSLPDCSSSGGTNTIKFKGQSGELTDGGAINTLTEEEIAVAAAKGWTVSLV